MYGLRWTSVLLLALSGCGRSILILPGVGEEGDTGDGDSTGTLTIGEEETVGGSSVCGDGIVDGDELCDGSDLDGWTCADFGFEKGELACMSGCTIDASGCSSSDGDSGDGDSGDGDSGTESDTGGTAGAAEDGEGCNCSTDEQRWAWGPALLVWVALIRRRRD